MYTMKTLGRVLLMIASFIFMSLVYSSAQVNIIFDTDFGGDVDDLGAMAMLHHLVDKNECKLLGVMCWSTEQYAVSAIDAVNRFYKHPDIPIGVRKGDSHHVDWCYSKPICDRFDFQHNRETVEEATRLYRRILTKADNKSVSIVTVGPLKNIENLINSKKDDISELSGVALIQEKVKEFVIMGGQYPEGPNEWNFNGDMKGVTKNVIEELKVPIVFLGYELGQVIKTGLVLKEQDPNTPLYTGWLHFSKYAPWMEDFRTGDIIDNATYDQTAVLYAVRGGIGQYWEPIKGKCLPDEKGGNTWQTDANANHVYLKLLTEPEELAHLIEKMMLGTF